MIISKKKIREFFGAIFFLIPTLVYSQRLIASEGFSSCADFDNVGFSIITIIVGLPVLILIAKLPNRTPFWNVWDRLNQNGINRIFEVLVCLGVKLFGSFFIGMIIADFFKCGGSIWDSHLT